MSSTDIQQVSAAQSDGSQVGRDIRALRDNDVAMVTTYSPEQRMEALTAITEATPISEQLGKKFQIQHIVVQEISVADERTAEVTQAARTVLVTPEGEAYAGVSKGLMISVRNLLAIFGDPQTWEKPIFATVVQKGKAPRAYFTATFEQGK